MQLRNGLTLHEYKVKAASGWSNSVVNAIASATLTHLIANVVDIYNMQGDKGEYNAGVPDERLCIFGNHAHTKSEGGGFAVETLIIGDVALPIQELLPHRNGNDILHIMAGEHVIAEFDKNRWELYILFDLFGAYNDATKAALQYLFTELERLYFFPKLQAHSWLYSQEKDKLTERLTVQMKQAAGRTLEEDKRRFADLQHKEQDYRQKLKTTLDTLTHLGRSIVTNEEHVNAIGDKLLKEMDLICAHEKVKDLHIKDGKFTVYTNPLIITSDKGERYFLGEMRIEIVPENTNIHFFGNNGKRGFWTQHDPHPHVNGSNGQACLGNASSMIAELCHQMQLYPLVLTCIDFLESANTTDPAGAKVVNWPKLNKDGSVPEGANTATPIDTDEDDLDTCYECGNHFDDDNLYVVYGDYNTDDEGDRFATEERDVCENCRANHYHWSDDLGEYIHNDVDID